VTFISARAEASRHAARRSLEVDIATTTGGNAGGCVAVVLLSGFVRRGGFDFNFFAESA
jgi:hypothetical protein